MGDVFDDIEQEHRRQFKLWGQQNHSRLKWLAILVEEVGEAAANCIEEGYWGVSYRAELIQVAAVAIAAVESYDRNEHAEV